MKAELEVKFLDVDIEDMRNRLKSADATLEQPLRLMRRVVIEQREHKAEHAFLRVRDEGDKTTLTFKRRRTPHPTKIDDVKEIEVTVSDFDATVEIFKEAGWPYLTYQETERETWKLDGAEVAIDHWPWLPLYIEVEGPTEEAVKQVAKTLGFDWNDAFYGQIDDVYALHYTFREGVRGIIDVPDARLSDPVPEQFKG